jgi:hypothetical protein
MPSFAAALAQLALLVVLHQTWPSGVGVAAEPLPITANQVRRVHTRPARWLQAMNEADRLPCSLSRAHSLEKACKPGLGCMAVRLVPCPPAQRHALCCAMHQDCLSG